MVSAQRNISRREGHNFPASNGTAIYTSIYPSLLKLTLVQESGLHLALEPQPTGSLRTAAESYSSLEVQLLEQPKEENNPNMHPNMCGSKKNDKDAFNSSLL